MHKIKWSLALLLIQILPVQAVADVTTLSFNSPMAGTLTDANGLGTGFTSRLPGTGGGIPIDDPNMNLLSLPGFLQLTSNQADISGQINLSQMEALGLHRPNIADAEFSISMSVHDLVVPNASDQLFLYVGSSSANVLRGGFHQDNRFYLIYNGGSLDNPLFVSPSNAFTPNDEFLLSITYSGGLFEMSWNDLTNATSGSTGAFSVPAISGESDLYVGVLAANSNSPISFTGNIDYFEVNSVPEASSFVLVAAGLAGLCLLHRRSKN